MSCVTRSFSSFALPAAVMLIGTQPVFAQDANLESRLDNAIQQTPPPVLRPEVKEEVVITTRPVTSVKVESKKKSRYTLQAIVNRDRIQIQGLAKEPFTKKSFAELCKDINDQNAGKKKKDREQCFYPVKRLVPGVEQVKTKEKVEKPPKTQLLLAVPTSESFQTNGLSQPDARADQLFTTGADATLSVPLGDGYTLGVNGNYTALRYDRFDFQDRDVLTGFVSLSHLVTPNQSISAKFQTRSSWRPSFEGDPTVIYQPSLQWNFINIDLGGPKCGTAGSLKSCIGWTFILNAGHSFVESTPAADNTFGSAQTSAAWTLLPGKLTWRSSGKVTARDYQNSPADREDLQFDGSTALEWTPSPNITVSAGGAYTHNGSTFDPVEYTNYQFVPQVKFSWLFE